MESPALFLDAIIALALLYWAVRFFRARARRGGGGEDSLNRGFRERIEKLKGTGPYARKDK